MFQEVWDGRQGAGFEDTGGVGVPWVGNGGFAGSAGRKGADGQLASFGPSSAGL